MKNLRNRAKRKDLTEGEVRQLARQYGITTEFVDVPQRGYRNAAYRLKTSGDLQFNLLIYKQEPGILYKIKRANYLGDYLASMGFPARQTADKRIAVLKHSKHQQYACLYHYLPGHSIPWESYTMEHIKTLGATMSRMHNLLKPIPRELLPNIQQECELLREKLGQYFQDPGVIDALNHKLHITIVPPKFDFAYFTKTETNQALHMDFVRSNILFADGYKAKISGVLDFEKAAWGPPIYDIARTLAFLIVDCKYKSADSVYKYFLFSGYNKRGKGVLYSRSQLQPLINFFLLYDFYKFLRHTPYESLPKNQHFVRTCQFLAKQRIILPAKNATLKLT